MHPRVSEVKPLTSIEHPRRLLPSRHLRFSLKIMVSYVVTGACRGLGLAFVQALRVCLSPLFLAVDAAYWC